MKHKDQYGKVDKSSSDKKNRLVPIILDPITREEKHEITRALVLHDVKRILRKYPNDIKRRDIQAALWYALDIDGQRESIRNAKEHLASKYKDSSLVSNHRVADW